ncbi:FMN-binding protein [Falsiporphyromonas endometrii]|uniref:FMN-binding protein n=1 Tax=Falsiporphyromonas endometrii TaxID=1387297 RepID=A0ABV9K876_9PORP
MKRISKVVAVLCMSFLVTVLGWSSSSDLQQNSATPKTITKLADGTTVINTTVVGKDIVGYAGAVPLEIGVKQGKVVYVKALSNKETPGFFRKASRILNSWNGKTVKEASKLQVDAVTGATFSSKAIIKNVQAGLKAMPKGKR